jgi:hypothetical protein
VDRRFFKVLILSLFGRGPFPGPSHKPDQGEKEMKKWILALLVGTVLAGTSSVVLAADFSGGTYVGVYDKYLWRGFDLSNSKAVVQPGADLAMGGFTLGLWGNYDIDTDKLNEVDVTLDYTVGLGETISLSLGNIYYSLDSLEDTNEAYVGMAVDALLSPSLTAYWDWDQAKSDGLFFVAAVGHTMELTDQVALNLGAAVTYNLASDYAVGSYRDWHNYELAISADYAVTDAVTISPSFLFSSAISNSAKEAISDEVLAGLSLGWSF